MLIQISGLINKPAYCLETKSIAGKVSDVVINPENGQIIAFLIYTSFLANDKAISFKDIIELKPDYVLISKESSAIEPKEILKVKEILDQRIHVLNNWVRCKSGEWLGRVNDLLFESDTFMVVKYYIRGTAFGPRLNPFLGTMKADRIVSNEQVFSISAHEIVVDEDTKIKEKSEATAVETA